MEQDRVSFTGYMLLFGAHRTPKYKAFDLYAVGKARERCLQARGEIPQRGPGGQVRSSEVRPEVRPELRRQPREERRLPPAPRGRVAQRQAPPAPKADQNVRYNLDATIKSRGINLR